MDENRKEQISTFLRGWVGSFIIALLIATSIKSAIADWYVVPTGSMIPTIIEGDRIFVNKLAYDLKVPYTTWHMATWDNPKRGDIVVFYSPEDGKRLVKRVIGISGDTIAMRDNRLFINGEAVKYEPFPKNTLSGGSSDNNLNQLILSEDLTGRDHPVMITPYSPSRRSFGPLTVPKGQYFMMGDNRDNSADSRYFGFVERKQIVGRAITVVMSLDLDNYYWPRWERFFTKLP